MVGLLIAKADRPSKREKSLNNELKRVGYAKRKAIFGCFLTSHVRLKHINKESDTALCIASSIDKELLSEIKSFIQLNTDSKSPVCFYDKDDEFSVMLIETTAHKIQVCDFINSALSVVDGWLSVEMFNKVLCHMDRLTKKVEVKQ